MQIPLNKINKVPFGAAPLERNPIRNVFRKTPPLELALTERDTRNSATKQQPPSNNRQQPTTSINTTVENRAYSPTSHPRWLRCLPKPKTTTSNLQFAFVKRSATLFNIRASLESPSDSGFKNGIRGPTGRARRKFANLAG